MKTMIGLIAVLLCTGVLTACSNTPSTASSSEAANPPVVALGADSKVSAVTVTQSQSTSSTVSEESSSQPVPTPALRVTMGDQQYEVHPTEADPPQFQAAKPDALPRLLEQSDAQVTVMRGNDTLYEGTAGELTTFLPHQNGIYQYTVQSENSGEQGTYQFLVETSFPPSVSVSGDGTAALGETLAIYVDFAEGLDVSTQTELSHPPVFYDVADARKMALLPVSYYTKPGTYGLDLTVGSETFHLEIQANDREFVVQNLTVDEDTTNDTIDNDFAIREWNEKIEPLKYITDPQQYWTGPFLMPVKGRTTTEFGTIRYTNGSSNASRHGALDIAAPTGTPVPAANAGRVIFAQFIQMSGNVVVIEHGLGLKTWYFHMDEIDVEEGAMVKQGEIIGKVGATGFVTGPHLHYGMSVNEVYINPQTATNQGIG